MYVLSCFSHVQLFVTPRTVAPQAPLSMGKNTRVGCHFPLQGIFLTQRLNLCLLWLLHCRWILYHWAIRISKLSSPVTINGLNMRLTCAAVHCAQSVWLFATPWTVACQAHLSTEFSRQEHWNRLLFPPPGARLTHSCLFNMSSQCFLSI